MEEFQFYLDNQAEFVKKYDGRVIALKGRVVLGDYEDYREALTKTAESHEVGTFLLQKVSPGDKDYTATFHSRVAFS